MRGVLAFVALVVLAGGAVGVWAYREERDTRRADVQRLELQLRTMQTNVANARRDLRGARRESALLAARLRTVSTRVQRARVSLQPLAARIRQSVFTVKAAEDEGSGFVGWIEGGATYVITANHVVGLSVDAGKPNVRLLKRGRVWRGVVVKLDDVHDLALIRVQGRIAPALWQRPVYHRPQAGAEILLVGSALGYEGTVSAGLVSRVLRNEIQTDAAGHPGGSGGPAVDRNGNVIGVLVSGEAENLNFLAPISLMCKRIRRC